MTAIAQLVSWRVFGSGGGGASCGGDGGGGDGGGGDGDGAWAQLSLSFGIACRRPPHCL